MIRTVNDITAEAWQDRFRRFSSTSMTVQKSCDAERVSLHSFYYWQYVLNVANASGQRDSRLCSFSPALDEQPR